MYSIWDPLDFGLGIADWGLSRFGIWDFGFRIKGSEIMIGILSV